MDKKNELLIRVYFVLFMFVCFAILILGRVVKITLVEGDKWRSKGGQNVKFMDKSIDRGDIYDANGNLLATSLPFFEIRMDLLKPRESLFNSNIDSLAICLAKLFPDGKSANQWKSELLTTRNDAIHRGKTKGVQYYFIANNVTINELEQLRNFPIFRKGRYGGGLIIERKSKRKKPFKGIAARTIGEDRSNADNVGIEGSFDKFLRGETEKQLMRKISSELWVPVINPAEFDSKKGDDVITTLDMHFQDIVHLELLRGLKNQDAKAGTAILMEVETGAIKAISNLEKLENGNYAELYNYGIGWSSEPGSTIKAASMLALLEKSCMSLNETVSVYGGKKKFYGEWMHDSERHGKDKMTVAESFKLSSNVGIATVVDECFRGPEGVKDFIHYFRQFGLHNKTEIEIQGEGNPFIKDPVENKKEFWKTTVPWMSTGYELHLTPLQILAFYNAVANDGKRMKPYLVDRIIRDETILHDFKPKVVQENIASIENIKKLQDLMKSVVLSGTGSRLKTDEFSFAGKTGTTRLEYNKELNKKKYNASFAGYFPAENPQYSLIVVVYEPQKQYYGSSVAGPIFKGIAEKCHSFFFKYNTDGIAQVEEEEFMLNKKHSGYAKDYNNLMAYMDVDYDKTTNNRWVDLLPTEEEVKMDKSKILKSKVPDVRGMGLRDAIYVLESLGLSVKTGGVGKVGKQSIRPGTEIKGQEIELFLN